MLKGPNTPPPPKVSAAERAETVRRAAIIGLAHWGHLRCAELARVVWPNAKYSEQLCQRLVCKLENEGLIHIRLNSVGTRSFVLTRRGAALAQAMGIDARHGLDLSSVSGATFIHRSLATRYGIEMQIKGIQAYGEHAMAGKACPLNRETIHKALNKLPDLILINKTRINWVEVESSAKTKDEIKKCLRIATECGKFFPNSKLELHTLTFVCDNRLNHESRIRKAAAELWGELHLKERASFLSRVKIVHVKLGPCSAWKEFSQPQNLTM